ncbi:MAG: hypothetical protein JSR58_02080 [Verrucomicrobia bacterium]|nr:hypothetical protein [Verrucomicrobiota bacterium]
MEIEKFLDSWWSDPLSPEMEEWVEKTYQDPFSFFQSLATLHKKQSLQPPKSEVGQSFDFYHDCVLRHVESNNAIISIDESGFIQTWTYKKLHRAVNFQVKAWSKAGVKPGQVVVLTMAVGLPFFIALLTALRMGLTLCYLASSSPYLSHKHLLSLIDQVQPAYHIAHKEEAWHASLKCAKIVVENLGEDVEVYDPVSYAYPADQVMQLSVALHRQLPFTMVPLDAQTTYLNALRDGIVTLHLKPGVAWASTFSCSLRTQPCTTLMGLLGGATLVHIEEKAFENDPDLLKSEKLHLLGVSPSLQKFLSKHPISFGKQLKGYYKSTFSSLSTWNVLAHLSKLEDTPAFHCYFDNSYGGSILISKPFPGDLNFFLKPGLGLSWYLIDLNGSEEPTLKGLGYFSPQLTTDENTEKLSNFILAQVDKNMILTSCVEACKEGVTIPTEKIEKTLTQLSFVEGCVLHAFPKMGEIASFQTILLVFVHPLKNNVPEKTKEEWTQSLRHQISEEIGEAFIPDHIEFYPLVPPKKEGVFDRDWCIEQYSSGKLYKKRESQVYQLISALKKLSQETLHVT